MSSPPTRTPSAKRRGRPSYAAAVACGLLLLCAAVPAIDTVLVVANSDAFAHVDMGTIILENRTVDRAVIGRYLQNAHVVLKEWLGQAAIAAIHMAAGLDGLCFAANVAFALLVLLFLYLCFGRGRPRDPALLALSAAAVLVLFVNQQHASPRALANLLLLHFVAAAVGKRGRQGRGAAFWLLPATTALLANVHGSWIVGPALLLCLAFADLTPFLERGEAAGVPASAVRLAACAAACVAAATLTPDGLQTLRTPFSIAGGAVYAEAAEEWRSPSFRQISNWPLLAHSLLLAWILLSRRAASRRTLVATAAFWTLALLQARNASLYVLVSTVLVCRDLGVPKPDRPPRADVALAVAALAISLSLYALGWNHHDLRGRWYEPSMQFLARETLVGTPLNEGDAGSLILHRMPGRYRVLLLGYMNRQELADYLRVFKAKEGWERIADRYDWLYVYTNPPDSVEGFSAELPRALYADRRNWHLVYSRRDEISIFVRRNGKNDHLVRKYPDVRPQFPVPRTSGSPNRPYPGPYDAAPSPPPGAPLAASRPAA